MSLANWLFQSNITVGLDTVIFVSPPSALKLTAEAAGVTKFGFNNLPETACVKNGRLDFYVRTDASVNTTPIIAFRVGSQVEWDYNCPFYELGLFADNPFLRWWNGEEYIFLHEWEYETERETWLHFRLSWWENANHLIIRLEQETGGVWSMAITDYDTLTDYGAADPLNRCGVGLLAYGYTGLSCWFDDVKIERLVSVI